MKNCFRHRPIWLLLAGLTLVSAPGLAGDTALPNMLRFPNPTGFAATFSTTGKVDLTGPFFQSLGTNGRSCGSCHQPSDGWTVTPAHLQERFDASGGTDPVFRTVDGSNAPELDVSTVDARRSAYSITPDMPLYTLRNLQTGQTTQTTDPGRALLTGKWKDIGRFKGPVLRGLATRAPYFHNGSAADLAAVVDFYNTRFTLALSDQEKSDLIAFLQTL